MRREPRLSRPRPTSRESAFLRCNDPEALGGAFGGVTALQGLPAGQAGPGTQSIRVPGSEAELRQLGRSGHAGILFVEAWRHEWTCPVPIGMICFRLSTILHMVTQKHFQRLKHMYASSHPEQKEVGISFGRVELDGTLEAVESEGALNRMPHHRLLSDAASLAAGSLEKEHTVTAEEFTVTVVTPDYSGPVVATAEVVMAEPPRYVVEAELWSEEEVLVADAMGVFRPGETDLPPVPEGGESEDEPDNGSPPPASFMPVHTTPYGVLNLN